jgi:plasmid stabilization system protein ParE
MNYTVRELLRAKQDKRSIFTWLLQRSPSGAAAWLDAYDDLVERLNQAAESFRAAPEHQHCDFDVRQALFKTRRGRVYRVLFSIDGHDVYILRVRGPGQAPVQPEDI